MDSMITIGADFHKRTTTFKILSPDGRCAGSKRIVNSRENLRNYLSSLAGRKRLAVEATRSWSLFYDCVHDLVEEFHLDCLSAENLSADCQTNNDLGIAA